MRARPGGAWALAVLLACLAMPRPATAQEAPAPPDALAPLRALIQEGHYAEAEDAARGRLASVEKEQGAASLEAADVLDVLVEAMRLGGKVNDPQAREAARRALSIREERFGPVHVDVARSANNLANLLVESGDYAGAKPLFERALAVQEQTVGPDHPLVGNTLNNLANLVSDMGDYAGSKPLYDRALRIKEQAHGRDGTQLVSTLINEAILLRLMGDYTEARLLAERALSICQAKLRKGHPRTAIAMETLASVLEEAGDTAAAERLHEQVLAMRREELSPDHPDLATSYASLAAIRKAAGDLAGARTHLEQALAIQTRSLEADSAYMAPNLVRLGEVRREMGDPAAARELFERSARILERHFGPSHPDLAGSLEQLAGLQGTSAASAIPLLERALAIRESSLGPRHPLVAESLARLAEVLHEAGRRQEAFERALLAETIGRDHLRLTASALGDREALRYASHRPSGLDRLIAIASEENDAGRVARTWDAVIRSRALVLDEMAARHRLVSRAEDDETARLAKDLRSARGRLATLAARGPGEQDPALYRALLDQAAAEAEQAERALAHRSRGFLQASQREVAGLEEVAGSLPDGSAVAAFLKTGSPARYVAFVLASGRATPVLIVLGEAGRIEPLVQRWRDAASHEPSPLPAIRAREEADHRAASEDLREAIWDRMATSLNGAKRVFLITDGALNLVSFAALQTGGHYLLETGPLLHMVSSERDLLGRRAPRSVSSGLLVLGGPDFEGRDETALARVATAGPQGGGLRGSTSGCPGFASLRFEPLAAAALEAREVETVWRKERGPDEEILTLVGPQAIEEAFKHLAPAHQVVHIATHGFFLESECGGAGAGNLPENPLLRSGLAFAGANQRARPKGDRDDGILTAEEIASLDLSGVDWLVLSACDTALGSPHSGEGVLGLRRACHVAGAGTLIMSLWKVQDEAARLWMRRLYERRVAGLPADEAVRRAGLDTLSARRRAGESTHPFYWGAFVAVGDWR